MKRKKRKKYIPPHDMMADCWREVIAQYERDLESGKVKPWDPDVRQNVGPTAWTEHAGSRLSLLDREP